MHEHFEFVILEIEFLAKKNDHTWCYFVVLGYKTCFLFPLRAAERKHYHPGDDGDVEHALGPEGSFLGYKGSEFKSTALHLKNVSLRTFGKICIFGKN